MEGRSRTQARGALIAVVAAVAVAAVLLATSGDDGPPSLASGNRNPLAGPASASTTGVAVTSVPTTTPPPTVAPTPMVLPPGPAPAIARVTTTDPVIFLGIDDGLTRDPAVLAYLAARRIPYVAFLNAGPLQTDPAYWAEVLRIGGTIQAHSVTHPNLTKVSVDQVRREVCGSADAIQQATGTRATLFRPPYGAYNATVQAIAAECGFVALAMWKGSTNDGRVDMQEHTLTPGDILLMHWRPDLLQNLRAVVAQAAAQGLRIGRLEDYVQPVP